MENLHNDIVLPLSFNNGYAQSCPGGYTTFGGRFFIMLGFLIYINCQYVTKFLVQTTDNTGERSSCVFPFRYNGQLYYECIHGFEDRSNPWCSTTFDYNVDMHWGYCVDVKCFKLVEDKKTFDDARIACKKENAYLASVHNEMEQCKTFQIIKIIIVLITLVLKRYIMYQSILDGFARTEV